MFYRYNITPRLRGDSLSGLELDNIVLLSEKAYDMMKIPIRTKILTLIGQGISKVTEISEALKVNKGIISRHLKMLRKIGIVESREGRHRLTSMVYLVYTVPENEHVSLHVQPRGAIFDPINKLFLVVNGKSNGKCKDCDFRPDCVISTKSIARRLRIKLRSEEPAGAYLEIALAFARRALRKSVSIKVLGM